MTRTRPRPAEAQSGHEPVPLTSADLRPRRELLGSRLLAVYGHVERESDVVHLIAGKLVDLTPMLGALQIRSRDFH